MQRFILPLLGLELHKTNRDKMNDGTKAQISSQVMALATRMQEIGRTQQVRIDFCLTVILMYLNLVFYNV